MSDKTHEGLKWVMRAGFGARGAIYVVVGLLALWAAFSSAEASGTKDALASLRSKPLGNAALWIIGLGMLCYMLWRIVAGVADVEDEGRDAKGLFSRMAQIVTGLLHGAIGISVIGLALGQSGQGGGAQDWTARLMSMPMGRWLVAAGAVVLAGAGIYYVSKGWRGTYKDHLANSALTRRLDPVLTIGLVIYGGLLVVIAISLGFAALNADPQQAGGLGHALQELRQVAYGRFILAGAALGLMSFALFNFVEAAYRVVPKLDGDAVETLKAQLQQS